jgi:hypothetical protein
MGAVAMAHFLGQQIPAVELNINGLEIDKRTQ